MNRERFERAIKILSEVDDKYFDLETWGQKKMTTPRSIGTVQSLTTECGTRGCAIGWIASDPWIQKEGLALYADRELNGVIYCLPQYYIPGFEIEFGFPAIAAFFDIPYNVADKLFSRQGYPYEKIEDEGYVRDNRIPVQDVIAEMKAFLEANS